MSTQQIREQYLDRRQAADYLSSLGLHTPRQTLHRYAMRRRKFERGENVTGELGPPYAIYGIRAVYRKADLDTWLAAKLGKPQAAA